MIKFPRSLKEVEQFIDAEVQESVELEYKGSDALGKGSREKQELAKDVSAFANSAGGVIIYGVDEHGHVPVGIDGGVDHQELPREWLEQVIMSNVEPRLTGLEIVQIPLNGTHSVYVVSVQQSHSGPYQVVRRRKYYKRHNFSSEPMHHYEIEDVRARRTSTPPLLHVEGGIKHGVLAQLIVRNLGDVAAHDVIFEFEPELVPREGGEVPSLFEGGVRAIPAGKEIRYGLGGLPDLLDEGSVWASRYEVDVSYTHSGSGIEISDTFYIDFHDALHTAVLRSGTYESSEKIAKAIKELTAKVTDLVKHAATLTALIDHTGLALSHRSLRNLRRVLGGEPGQEPIPKEAASRALVKEVLGVDWALASRIGMYLSYGHGGPLEEIEGMTPDLLKQVHQAFSGLDEA